MVRIECEQCHTVGRLQQIGKSYFRIRHYKGINKETNKSEFYYHQQSKEYIAKLNLEHNLIPSNAHSIEHLNTNIEQKLKDSNLFLRNMAGEVGFEPTTPNLGGWCSIRDDGKTTHDHPSAIRAELLAQHFIQQLPSIQNLLLYLKRKGRSENTRIAYEKYLKALLATSRLGVVLTELQTSRGYDNSLHRLIRTTILRFHAKHRSRPPKVPFQS